ncbi:hypothetical protein M9H77_30771 [Catharanthus roseus]|uniref:Uncharacterized protein n=1 Tax=Catharanthus roseus TaxID=4058 RepID=A0ACB9ZZ18_CATRO|nr:hypothetical protein M9H77_30771 [Catharanthus roseus]
MNRRPNSPSYAFATIKWYQNEGSLIWKQSLERIEKQLALHLDKLIDREINQDGENIPKNIDGETFMENFKVFDEFPVQTCSTLHGKRSIEYELNEEPDFNTLWRYCWSNKIENLLQGACFPDLIRTCFPYLNRCFSCSVDKYPEAWIILEIGSSSLWKRRKKAWQSLIGHQFDYDDVIDQIISLSSSSPSFESEIITESIDGDNSVENFKAFD